MLRRVKTRDDVFDIVCHEKLCQKKYPDFGGKGSVYDNVSEIFPHFSAKMLGLEGLSV